MCCSSHCVEIFSVGEFIFTELFTRFSLRIYSRINTYVDVVHYWRNFSLKHRCMKKRKLLKKEFQLIVTPLKDRLLRSMKPGQKLAPISASNRWQRNTKTSYVKFTLRSIAFHTFSFSIFQFRLLSN